MTGPQDWPTTIGLIAATLAGAIGCAAAAARIARGEGGQLIERFAAIIVTVLAGGVFLYRAVAVHEAWAPLEYHVDGLSLMAAMLGVVAVYLQWTRRVPGVSIGAVAAATLLSLWGVCASWWTLREFDLGSAWRQVHLMSVYLGTFGVAVAAAAGAMWLYVDRQLRSKDHRAERLKRLGRLASLEALEATVTRSATLGFVLLTAGLATGVVVIASETAPTRLGGGWWYSPKVILAAAAWLIFALVMNVRYIATFRGRRAAVLSIVGFVLLIGVFGIVQALPGEVESRRSKIEHRGLPIFELRPAFAYTVEVPRCT